MPVITARMLDPQGYLMPYQKKQTRTADWTESAENAIKIGKFTAGAAGGVPMPMGAPAKSANESAFAERGTSSPYQEALADDGALPANANITMGKGAFSKGVEPIGSSTGGGQSDVMKKLILAILKGSMSGSAGMGV